MDVASRRKLEKAGFRVGDTSEFLALSDAEKRLVELRLAVSQAIRRLRGAKGMTQQQLATEIGSSASRVNKLERGAADVSLDLMFRGLFAVGGDIADLRSQPAKPAKRQKTGRPRRAAS